MKCNVSYKYLFIAHRHTLPAFSACDYADGEVFKVGQHT